MKKDNKKAEIVVGMDISDKKVDLCLLNKEAAVVDRVRLSATQDQIGKWFAQRPKLTVALETGTHSRWISSLLERLGHTVIVAHARALKMIYASDRKTDIRDAEMLARLALADPHLLSPIQHRGEQAHRDLTLIHSRDQLVKTRGQLVVHIRGSVKAMGLRIGSCSTPAFTTKVRSGFPELLTLFGPVLAVIDSLTEQIKVYDKKIESISKELYPETVRLRRIHGVGPIVALAYVLTLENPARFKTSRAVGSYLGLTARQDQSGEQDRRSRITKAGNALMRRLLVQSAQHIMGPFGAECDLRRWGKQYAERGGPPARKRAKVAVARKLAVIMHALWKNGRDYDPEYLQKKDVA